MATRSESEVTSPLSPGKPDKCSFFLTDRQMSRSLDFDEHDLTADDRGGCGFVIASGCGQMLSGVQGAGILAAVLHWQLTLLGSCWGR